MCILSIDIFRNKIVYYLKICRLGVMLYACDNSIWKVEEERLKVQHHPKLHETMS